MGRFKRMENHWMFDLANVKGKGEGGRGGNWNCKFDKAFPHRLLIVTHRLHTCGYPNVSPIWCYVPKGEGERGEQHFALRKTR